MRSGVSRGPFKPCVVVWGRCAGGGVGLADQHGILYSYMGGVRWPDGEKKIKINK